MATRQTGYLLQRKRPMLQLYITQEAYAVTDAKKTLH